MSKSRSPVQDTSSVDAGSPTTNTGGGDNGFWSTLLGYTQQHNPGPVVGGLAGREGAVQPMLQRAYQLGLDAPRSDYVGDVFRGVPNTPERVPGTFDAFRGGRGPGAGRYNASSEGMIYTSPSEAEAVAEANAYEGMGGRMLTRATYEANIDPVTGRGGVADLTSLAQSEGLTEALTVPKGGGKGPLLGRLLGENPYSMSQQAGKGATDAGASGLKAPSATNGEQIDIIPRNTRPGQITPQDMTPFDVDPVTSEVIRGTTTDAVGINPMVEDVTPGSPGPLDMAAGEGGRGSSARLGGIGGGITALGSDLYRRFVKGEDVGIGQMAADTGLGTAMGAGSGLALDTLVGKGLSMTEASGAVGGVLEGGLSLINNASAYANGEIDGSHAIANTVVDTGIGVGAGIAGAELGAALGSIIPGAGTIVGAGLGFLGGMAGSYLVHALANDTGIGDWAKETLASGISMAGDGLSAAGGFLADTGAAAWDGVSGAASSAWDGVSGAASSAWDGVSGAASSAWDGVSGAASSAWDAATSW